MIMSGQKDEALKLVDPIFRVAPAQSLNWWRLDPDLHPKRDDPRFEAMLEQGEAGLAAPSKPRPRASAAGFIRR